MRFTPVTYDHDGTLQDLWVIDRRTAGNVQPGDFNVLAVVAVEERVHVIGGSEEQLAGHGAGSFGVVIFSDKAIRGPRSRLRAPARPLGRRGAHWYPKCRRSQERSTRRWARGQYSAPVSNS